MSAPQPIFDVEPSERLKALRQKRQKQRHPKARSARYRALGWEMTGRLTVNLVIALMGLSALVRLIPYYQTQRQFLQQTESSLEQVQSQNSRLRADFTRYFDPAQTSQAMQESSDRKSEGHIPVVLVDPLELQVEDGE
ncbi:hypothetical protein PN498_12100 [Oscillatoria sp. CS-180]|uniref:slr1601 family putative cell division protein n=1 Tax=Oscillatoria sp. CS-180 TaxID=3021720 RepID=UPI00232D054B|nr:hypothetical protein [Oscillatoria sp. CS-180]MDB9526734.1 hypothetical protein [Oscillatoria sp. CS-180]